MLVDIPLVLVIMIIIIIIMILLLLLLLMIIIASIIMIMNMLMLIMCYTREWHLKRRGSFFLNAETDASKLNKTSHEFPFCLCVEMLYVHLMSASAYMCHLWLSWQKDRLAYALSSYALPSPPTKSFPTKSP